MPEPVVSQPAAEETPETKGGPQGVEGAEPTTVGAGDQGGAEEKKPGAEGSESEATAEELVLEEVEKVGDEYVLKVGSSVYKGKTVSEVVKNALKGIPEKDSYIAQLRAEKVTRVPDKFSDRNILKGQPKEGSAVPELPDEQTVYQEEIRRALAAAPAGFRPEMLAWSEAQWDDFSEAEGVKTFRVSEYRSFVREARTSAKRATNERMDEASTVAINADIITTETEKVQKLLENSGLSEEAVGQFDYEAVLDRATKNRGKSGVIDSGAIVHEAALEIQRMLKDEHTSPAVKKLTDDIIRGKTKIAAIPAKGGSGASPPTTKELKPTGDWDTATDRVLKELGLDKK